MNWGYNFTMDTNPLVSIIINNYNYGSFLGQAIDTAICQTYTDIEIIVVDDGSTDDSHLVIAQYKNRIISVLKENGGQASAINAAFKVSHGDIIVFLDADDYLLPTAIECAIKNFQHEKIVKVHWPLWRVDKTGNKTGKVIPEAVLAEGNLRDQLIQYGPAHCGGPPHSPPTSGNAWARSFLDRVIPIPEAQFKGGVDNYLFVLTPLFGEIKSISEPQGYYRVHGTNNTLKPGYMTTFFSRFEYCCQALSHYLLQTGIIKDPSVWPRDHWFHTVYMAMEDIAGVVPFGASFILVDENCWVTEDTLLGRRRIYFLDENREYGGIPQDDEVAIRQLECQRENGAGFIVFAWSSFWWFDHFISLREHLYSKYTCILNNERVVIFELSLIK